MSAAKHTPGPWWAVFANGCWWIHSGPKLHEGFDDRQHNTICRMPGSNTQEAEGDARLIAAAPELLAALKVLLDAHVERVKSNMVETGSNEPTTEELFDPARGLRETIAARAAIAKAQGQA